MTQTTFPPPAGAPATTSPWAPPPTFWQALSRYVPGAGPTYTIPTRPTPGGGIEVIDPTDPWAWAKATRSLDDILSDAPLFNPGDRVLVTSGVHRGRSGVAVGWNGHARLIRITLDGDHTSQSFGVDAVEHTS